MRGWAGMAAVAVAAVLAGCGSQMSKPTGDRIPPNSGDPLDAGKTYRTKPFLPGTTFKAGGGFTVKVPEGLAGFNVGPAAGPGLKMYIPVRVADPKKGAATASQLVATPRDLLLWLKTNPDLSVRAVKPLRVKGMVNGFPGAQVDVEARRTPPRTPPVCAHDKPCAPLWQAPGGISVVAGDQIARFDIVNVSAQPVVIEYVAPRATFARDAPAWQKLVDSVVINQT